MKKIIKKFLLILVFVSFVFFLQQYVRHFSFLRPEKETGLKEYLADNPDSYYDEKEQKVCNVVDGDEPGGEIVFCNYMHFDNDISNIIMHIINVSTSILLLISIFIFLVEYFYNRKKGKAQKTLKVGAITLFAIAYLYLLSVYLVIFTFLPRL